ncbi:ribonuclease H-like domain-containing protein [Tanacetum coccineum]
MDSMYQTQMGFTKAMRDSKVFSVNLGILEQALVAMISMRIKKFYKKTGKKLQFDAKEPVGFDKTKVECYNCHKIGHSARECRLKEDNRRRDGWNTGIGGEQNWIEEVSKALVIVIENVLFWTTHAKDDED